MNRQIHKITRIPIRNVAFKFKDRLLGNSIAADGLTRSEATGMNFSMKVPFCSNGRFFYNLGVNQL